MKLIPCLLTLFAIAFASDAFAQDKTDYTLNDGQVHFHVPAGWNAIMEKADGNPQAVAFQVPDAAAQGGEDSASVTVKTRQLQGAVTFNAVVQEEFEHAKSQGGYSSDAAGTDASVHQYSVVRGKTKYFVSDSFTLSGSGSIVTQVRCQRPLLDKTPAAWATQFDSACASVVASLKQ
ncbi:MAG: hypothetical protein ABJB02_09635 [Dokdonella sp.]